MVIPKYVILHHSGAEEEDAEQVRRYHLSLGWADVGYNYIIERDGHVVRGRSLAIDGAHTKAGGMNHQSAGIALIGNLEKHRPYPRQLAALAALLQKLCRDYGIAAGNVLGHREVPGAQTICPGKYFPLDEVRKGLSPPLFRVQVGAFAAKANAESYARELRQKGIAAYVTAADPLFEIPGKKS